MSLAMILIQQNETMNPKTASIRKIYETMIGDKHEDSMAKFGAALSQGIIDAGGRNVTISMQNKSGSSNMPAIVGMALFSQFWYWFPLAHSLSLAFTPTAIIGVNKDLQVCAQGWHFICDLVVYDRALSTLRSPSSNSSRMLDRLCMRTNLRQSHQRRRLSKRLPQLFFRRRPRQLHERKRKSQPPRTRWIQ